MCVVYQNNTVVSVYSWKTAIISANHKFTCAFAKIQPKLTKNVEMYCVTYDL
jgi:hypothetical protein